MKTALSIFLLLYLVSLNTSMAGMELFAWLVTGSAFAYQFFVRRDFSIFKANRALNLWMVAMLVSIAASLWAADTLYRPFSFQFGFMRWVIVLWGSVFALQVVWSERFERALLNVWMVLIAVTGAYAVAQCLWGIDFIRSGAVEAQGGGVYRATGWLSAVLTFAYSFGISLFAMSVPAYRRYPGPVAGLVLTLGGLGLVAAMARGAWLAAAATLIIFLLLQRRWLGASLAAVSIYGLSKVLVWFSAGFGGKIEGMTNMTVDHSGSVRFDLWRGYWNMFLDNPWFGVGFEQGDKVLPEYFTRMGIDQSFVSHAHNNLLQFLGGAGIFGFVAYVGLNFVIFQKAWRLRSVSPWGWSILLAQIFLQIGGLTEANFIDGEVTHMFVFTWAILLVLEARPSRQYPFQPG